MKRLLMTLGLTCVLFVSAFAGDIHNVDSSAPAPGGTPQGSTSAPSQIPLTPGDIPTSDAGSVLDATLNALLTALGLIA